MPAISTGKGQLFLIVSRRSAGCSSGLQNPGGVLIPTQTTTKAAPPHPESSTGSTAASNPGRRCRMRAPYGTVLLPSVQRDLLHMCIVEGRESTDGWQH